MIHGRSLARLLSEEWHLLVQGNCLSHSINFFPFLIFFTNPQFEVLLLVNNPPPFSKPQTHSFWLPFCSKLIATHTRFALKFYCHVQMSIFYVHQKRIQSSARKRSSNLYVFYCLVDIVLIKYLKTWEPYKHCKYLSACLIEVFCIQGRACLLIWGALKQAKSFRRLEILFIKR